MQYSLDEQGHGLLSCLDINHTHFLLVDDGTRDYGVEIELRARLEKHISQQSLGNRGAVLRKLHQIQITPNLTELFFCDQSSNYMAKVQPGNIL